MARVVLADDHPLFLRALQVAVQDAGIEVTGLAASGGELLDLMDAGTPADAILLDLNMPGADGYQCMERIRDSHPDVRLIVVSATNEEDSIRRALDAGAVCFIGKSIDPTDLAAAVRALLSDAIRIQAPTRNGDQPAVALTLHGNGGETGILTKRELEILRLTAEGKSNSQMAKELWVTEQTVKFHLSNIYRKTEVRNRTEASRWAQQHGLLEPVD